jgi:hypothetical protein
MRKQLTSRIARLHSSKSGWLLQLLWKPKVNFISRPFYSREMAPGTHCVEVWVNPRAGLDIMEMRSIVCACIY